jgi:type IV pilus assembly protein PilY1
VDVYAVTMSPAFPELAFPVKDAAGKLISTVSILPVNISASVYGYPLQSFLNYFIIDWDTDRKGMSFHASVKVNFSDADETGDWEGDGQVTFVVDLLTDASTPGSMRESAPVTFDSGDSAVRANPDGSPAVLYKFANPADADTTDDFISIDSSQVKAILVRAYWVTTGTGAGMAMGYTISGTKRDGTYLGLTMNTPPPSEKLTPKDCQYLGFATSSAQGCGKQVANVKEQSRIFAIAESSSQVQALPNPLYLAAKYGGFDDANRNNVPDAGEWENPDGTPKTYFQATNISQLPTKLEAAFRTIARSVSSGTATSASIDTILGGGVSVQTIYYPEYSNPLNPDQKVKWAGSIVGLFVDKWGNLREDADQNGVLDQANGEAGSKGDPVVTFNSTTKEASNPPDCYKFGDFISRCFDAYGNNGLTLYRSPEEAHPASIHRIRPLFDTGKWLSRLSDEKLQSGSRGYAQAATQGAGKRRIYYGRPGGGEGLDLFDVSNSAALSKLLLHEDFGDHLPGNLSRAEASERLIRWIVGTDQPGWRPRVVGDPWGDNITPVTWRLGDVINSKPILVGAPTSNFDLLYGDRSYLAFRKAHAARRQMAYFGANDGMLHAVNVGFNGSLASGKVSFTPGDSSGGRPAHELGAEIWALIPGSLLAHLQFLPDPKYGHTYYVDLKPLIVDVKGGTAESPQWKTVLIGGLRLGGRPMIPASPAGASYSADGSQLEGFYYSEVFALDVTDPDVEPELMWSYSSLDMGLTVGLPSVVSNDGSWYAVIPSGPRTDVPNMPPNAAASGSLWNQPSVTFPREGPYGGNSIQQARLIVLDALNGRHMRTIVSDEPNSFFNNPFLPAAQIRATPWTNHVLYYGMTVARDPRTGMDEGGVYRLQMASADGTPLAVPDWRLARLYDAKRPVTGAVNSAYDSTGNLWVLFGTGRLWSLDDTAPCIFTPTAECRANHDQYIYGIKEELGPEGYLTFADRSDDPLVDVSGVQVYADGTISGLEPETPASEPVTGYDVLAYSIKTGPNAGYRRKLESGNLVFAGTHSYEMVVTQPKIVATGDGRSFITFTSFEPVNEACGGYGNGFLHLADTFTGLPHPSTQFVFHKPGVSPVSGAPAPAGNWVPGVVSTGDGSPSEAFVIYGADGITVGAVAPDASTHTGFIGMGGGSGMRLTSWREVLDTGFGVPPEVMSSGLDGAPPAAPAP